jgi:hypothetical protein
VLTQVITDLWREIRRNQAIDDRPAVVCYTLCVRTGQSPTSRQPRSVTALASSGDEFWNELTPDGAARVAIVPAS